MASAGIPVRRRPPATALSKMHARALKRAAGPLLHCPPHGPPPRRVRALFIQGGADLAGIDPALVPEVIKRAAEAVIRARSHRDPPHPATVCARAARAVFCDALSAPLAGGMGAGRQAVVAAEAAARRELEAGIRAVLDPGLAEHAARTARMAARACLCDHERRGRREFEAEEQAQRGLFEADVARLVGWWGLPPPNWVWEVLVGLEAQRIYSGAIVDIRQGPGDPCWEMTVYGGRRYSGRVRIGDSGGYAKVTVRGKSGRGLRFWRSDVLKPWRFAPAGPAGEYHYVHYEGEMLGAAWGWYDREAHDQIRQAAPPQAAGPPAPAQPPVPVPPQVAEPPAPVQQPAGARVRRSRRVRHQIAADDRPVTILKGGHTSLFAKQL